MMMVHKVLFSVLEFFTLLYVIPVTFASTEEATALLKWKATFKNENSSLLASWTPSSNACNDWYGVICSNGRVNRLNITNTSVIGTFYDFPFSCLPFLEFLDLSINDFSGTIPPEIGNLRSLTELDLIINSLYGSIPASLENLNNFSILYLFENQLSCSIPEEIEMGYLRLPKVSYRLKYEENSLNGSIPTSWGNLNNLSILYLYDNHLSGSVPEEIGRLRSGRPEVLEMNHNYLSRTLPTNFSIGSVLRSFNLHGNELEGKISASLANCCGSDMMAETNYIVSALDDQESNSEFLSDFWKATFMGYDSGLCIGLSIIHFMISTRNLKWLARIVEELEEKEAARRKGSLKKK
ncbi:hypothetical protein RND71_018426 [Anisodus tanguticus]|uniref:Leucine-rich repeat-containing N-terminal plant-type domain-containing protein n=1 Tax=Anisodus tanguticus TaxID=243964 RepID=A0AAE1S4D9_9SOLA|nr:hypothetical protein RND71_018426 [Anisodus tanguticus]